MSASGATAAAAATAGSSSKICFNTCCKEPRSEGAPRRKGWRLRSGEFADLCDRCSNSYEQGSFCETFHLDGDGWRKCESCGKRVHCGCIASAQMFALLDTGGIECITCAQKHYAMLPNQMWSPFLPMPSERLKDLPVKSWNPLNSTNPPPGQWRQPPHAWSSAVAAQSDLHQRLSFEFDRPSSIEKLIAGGRSSILDKNKTENISERLIPGSLNRSALDRVGNGNHVMKQSAFGTFLRDEGGLDGSQEAALPAGDSDHMPRKRVILTPCTNSSGAIKIERLSGTGGAPLRPTTIKDESAGPVIGLSSPFSPSLEASDPTRMPPPNQQHCQTPLNVLSKTLYHNSSNSVDSSGDSQNQIRNGRPRAEGRGKSHLLPRYWPRITDQELQQISGDSNAVITPLFEKMLSASDAGRIGRLVLPKKCAEAYFPAISQPEGLPLKVQDASGKEWIFQFRFWPNNNSRMYVLEGVTPCIQSMQLQAGDIVTFSRIDPEGKLVMGFRKASNVQNEMVIKAGNGLSSSYESNTRSIKQGEMIPSSPLCYDKANPEATAPCNPVDHATQSKIDKLGFIQKERPSASLSGISNKRKNSALGTKSKRLRIDNEESIELKLTWEEAQELLRPPPNQVPTIVLIDGHEFEEYEEAPVLGRPTIFTTNQAGGKDQWAQCEDCLKWRRLPVDALLPPRWTCACNVWDSERSSCLSAQEISQEQLADLLPLSSVAPKRNKAKVHNVIEGADGLDTLANLAILGEGEVPLNPTQPTTKHPRHRPGCTCIVCIQPPSGKGPKHKQTCTCNVCLTVKRRFRTLMLRKEKRQSEKEAETARKKQQLAQSPEMSLPLESDKDAGNKTSSHHSKNHAVVKDGVDDEGAGKRKELLSPVKTEIDLNMQPEREEEHSLLTDSGSIASVLQEAAS